MQAEPDQSISIPAARTQAQRRSESDLRMLKAATELLGRNGVRGTSLAEIGVLAGYSRGLPVERYGSKLGLIRALLDAMDDWITMRFEEAVSGLSGWDALLAAVNVHIESAANLRDGSAAFRAIRMECRYVMPEVGPIVTSLLSHWRSYLTRGIEQAQRDGTMRTDIAAERLARTTTAILTDFVVDRDPDDVARAEDVEELRALLRQLLTTPHPATPRRGPARHRRSG